MPDVSIFNLGGQNINVKDGIARSTAQSAKTTATEAKSSADQALQLVQQLEQLSRVTVSYEESTKTITITTKNHEGA